jgi:site-specific DNA-cytosine methylase
MRDGIYVIELFGGMCGGLQMLLDNGFTIRQYFYCDVSPAARQVAEHRLMSLHSQFPAQFPFEAWPHAFSLPQDVYLLDREALLQAGCDNGRQWFFIAGFECQDLSPAGRGRGLFGPRSQTFFPMLQVLGELQILQHEALLPMYFIENTDMNSVDSSTVAVRSAYDEICSLIGIPVSLGTRSGRPTIHSFG